MMPDERIPDYSIHGNILKDKMILNPEIQILFFEYPVHILHPKKITENSKGQYFVWVHRYPESKEVFFTHLSPASVRIIEALYDQAMNRRNTKIIFS